MQIDLLMIASAYAVCTVKPMYFCIGNFLQWTLKNGTRLIQEIGYGIYIF